MPNRTPLSLDHRAAALLIAVAVGAVLRDDQPVFSIYNDKYSSIETPAYRNDHHATHSIVSTP